MGRPLSAGGDGLLANNSLKSFGLFSLTITPLPLPSLPARLSFFVHRFLAFGNFFFLTNSLVTGLAFERDFLLLRGAILLIKRDVPSPSKNVDAEIAWNRIANRHRQEWSCFILGQTWTLGSLGVLQRSPQPTWVTIKNLLHRGYAVCFYKNYGYLEYFGADTLMWRLCQAFKRFDL